MLSLAKLNQQSAPKLLILFGVIDIGTAILSRVVFPDAEMPVNHKEKAIKTLLAGMKFKVVVDTGKCGFPSRRRSSGIGT